MMRLTDMEKRVFQMSLEDESFIITSGDLSTVPVISRERTGRSLYTYIQPGVVEVSPPTKDFLGGRVSGTINQNIVVTFLIYIKHGFVVELEGSTFEEDWPEVIESFDLYLATNVDAR